MLGTVSRYASNARSAWALAKSAWSGVKYIKGLVNSEVYKYDLDVTPTTDTSGTVTHISAVAIGDGDNNRTGNGIFVRSIYLRGTMIKHASATSTFVRMLIVQDTQQASDTIPPITGVLESIAINAPLNSDAVGKFNILRDKVFVLNSQHPQQVLQEYIPLKVHVRFNGTAGTDVQRNNMYVMFFSNEATNAPTVAYSSRVSYHDN